MGVDDYPAELAETETKVTGCTMWSSCAAASEG